MKKLIIPAMAGFGAILTLGAPAPAVAGMCETMHASAIAACGANGACADAADQELFECYKRMALVNE